MYVYICMYVQGWHILPLREIGNVKYCTPRLQSQKPGAAIRRQKSHPQTPIAKVKAKHQKLYPKREDHSTPVFGSRVRSQSVTVLRRSATVLTILCQNMRRSATGVFWGGLVFGRESARNRRRSFQPNCDT